MQRANLALASVANFDFINETLGEEKWAAFKNVYILACAKWKVASGTWRLCCRSRDRHSVTLRWTSWNYTHTYALSFQSAMNRMDSGCCLSLTHLVLGIVPPPLTRNNQQRCLTWSNFSLVPLAGIHFACTRTQSDNVIPGRYETTNSIVAQSALGKIFLSGIQLLPLNTLNTPLKELINPCSYSPQRRVMLVWCLPPATLQVPSPHM